ncbi:hypothetical protein [Ferviditalea candida]|uniref:Uncharacterized protein n=1 Tax=Ferviditalea candida TaxID=3108399 RepID=A0ABU5ZEC7_9BACL|nr:hypothetical protein [Paenibacillaceae bacterium T2]
MAQGLLKRHVIAYAIFYPLVVYGLLQYPQVRLATSGVDFGILALSWYLAESRCPD